MDNCVNKGGSEFKNLYKEYAVTPEQMELIIHSWWKTHSDGSYPNKEFIEKYLYGESVEMSDKDISVAENFNCFGSKEFSNREEAQSYYKRLASLYPKRAIGSYTRDDDKIVITLAKPIISKDSKYKDYVVPAEGSTITKDDGTVYTVKRISSKTPTSVVVETDKGFMTLYRENDNPNNFYYFKRAFDAYGNPDQTHYPVKVEDTIPYYSEYTQSTTIASGETARFTSPTTNNYNETTRLEQQQDKEQQDMEQVNKSDLTEEDQAYLDNCVNLNRGFNNLLASKFFTATEALDIADQMVNWISDLITDIQNGNKETIDKYKRELSNINISTADRVTIARAIGAKKLIEDCRNNFVSSQEGRNVNLRKLRQINNNWGALMSLATPTFIANEKFSITGDSNNITIVEEDNLDADNINASNEAAAIQENGGSAQEHWQIESRTKDIVQNATSLVRHALRQCYIVDENGNIEKTEFGINKRIKVQNAVKSILRWTQGATDIDEMIDMLKSKEQTNPWIKQIIDRLEDRSGKEADFQSQFFTSFCLREQLYSVVKAERDNDGNITYKSLIVNKSPALKEATNAVVNQFRAGQHPLFTSQGVNESALKELSHVRDILMGKTDEFVDFDEIVKLFTFSLYSLGYYASDEDVKEAVKDVRNQLTMRSALDNIVNAISKHIKDTSYNPFVYSKDDNADSVYRDLRKLLKPVTDRLEDTAISSFYNDGKMYQTYTTPSYLSNLLAKFHKGSEKDFEGFIQKQYGDSEWFKVQNNDLGSGWFTPWLSKMMRDSTGNMRKMFDHKVQLSFDSNAYMTQMSDLQYTLSILSEYFSIPVENGAIESLAWFRVPMLSNKTSSEYIKFYKYTGTKYKDSIALDMVDIMLQEIARIRTVNIRNLNKNDKGFIKNWDTKGKEFNLVSFLNKYLKEDKSTEFGNLLRKAVSKEGLTDSETETLTDKAKKVIIEEMQNKVNSILRQYDRDGLIEAAESIENIGKSQEEILNNIENFIWNDTLAAMNILELTITDPAYYSDAVDLQKRFAQIHAPGVRPNVKATDYKGNPVSDNYSRTIVLNDFKGLTSNIIENLEIVFQRKINSASTPSQKELYGKMKKDIIEQFRDINVTDAQAYNSPTSYRKKAILFGRWSKEKEAIYQRLMNGDYNFTDLQKAFGEVLKPFVYTQTMESVGKENSPIQNIPVPFQNKNSEYLLIMADAILRGEDTGKPNLLRAIYEVMEDSAKSDPLRGIDTVQFDSAVKSGLHDPINISQFVNSTEKQAKEHILNSIYESEKKDDGTYNRTTKYKPSVRLIEWLDYSIQQEVPQHFNTHFQAHGSQIRAITPSELSEGTEFMGMSREKFAAEYENTIAENIKESLDEIAEEFKINGSRKERNIAISKILRREVSSSSRYGIDLQQACLLNEDGEFNIPLGDPIQAKRIEQLINSVIKNNVNKQEIAGGPVVQVSNFGTSKSLNIRFKDKNGGLLLTRDEYKGDNYKKYIEENQAGVAYLEVYAPIYSDELFNRFADENGNIDVNTIEKLDPELLKMVGYRIPTEDKYSCAPIKIVGFLPREAGDGIMLPAEITLLSGSDFDIDKIYLMRKEHNIINNTGKIHTELYSDLVQSQNKKLSPETKKALHELVNEFLNRPYDKSHLINQKVADGYLSMTEGAYYTLLNAYNKALKNPNNMRVIWPTEGRGYRDNKIVDMTYEVLTHEDSADKLLNPGGFEPQKKLGYIVSALRLYGDKYSYNELNRMSVEELKKLSSTEQNLAFIDTHVQFYKQNSAAAALIGMFAVSKVAHAILERDPLYIKFDSASGLTVPMRIGNTTLSNMVKIDPTRDTNNTFIGKSLGSLVASAADAAKDPVLNLMNINKDTANILNTAIRLGIPFEDAALLLSQKCVANILNSINKDRIAGIPASLLGSINDRLDILKNTFGMEKEEDTEKMLSEGLSKDDLVYGVYKNSESLEFKALYFIRALLNINNELKGLTLITRFNSISNAAGPLIVDNLIMEDKLKDFSKFIYKFNTVSGNPENISNINTIFEMHPMLEQFKNGFPMARTIMRDMPLYSKDFRETLDIVKAQNVDSIINGRDNLSKFADFYVSYLLINNGIINPESCKYYIDEFPRKFLFVDKYKEKYRGNSLIDAIKLEIDSKTKIPALKVDITGLDTEQKDRLISGYISLILTDRELAIELFKYNFFRGGLGFTPKTFMSLTPLLLKQSIEGYSEAFSNRVTSDPIKVIDLFIRNNWKDSNFVKYLSPITDDRKPTFKVNNNGVLTTISDKSLYSRYSKQRYIRTKVNGVEKLYRLTYVSMNNSTLIYNEVKPLGNNKAYLEFTDEPIHIETNTVSGDNSNGVINNEPKNDDPVSNTVDMSDIMAAFTNVMSETQAKKKLQEFKGKSEKEKKSLESGIKNFLAKQFTKLNIKFDENKLNEEFKKMC